MSPPILVHTRCMVPMLPHRVVATYYTPYRDYNWPLVGGSGRGFGEISVTKISGVLWAPLRDFCFVSTSYFSNDPNDVDRWQRATFFLLFFFLQGTSIGQEKSCSTLIGRHKRFSPLFLQIIFSKLGSTTNLKKNYF